MPSDERFLEWTFPVAGIDRQEEFQEQPALTTPVAKNVRAFEPSSDRGRGGSRPGISRYLPQVPAGEHLIQHLKVIVDPQGALTGLSFGPDDTTTLDSSDGGRAVLDDGSTRIIRQGGSGFYTHPENEDNEKPSSGRDPIALVQSAQANKNPPFGEPTTDALQVALDAEAELGNLVVVCVFTSNTESSGVGVTVAGTGLGQTYTQAGEYYEHNSAGDSQMDYIRVSIWYRIVGSGEQQVTVTPSAACSIGAMILEYSNVTSGSPLDGDSGAADFGETFSAGTVPVNGAGEVVLAIFASRLILDDSPSNGFSTVESLVTDTPHLNYFKYFARVIHKLGNSSDQEPVLANGDSVDYSAAGASFKWSGG